MQIVENPPDSTIEAKNFERKTILSARGTITQITDLESAISERYLVDAPSNFDLLTYKRLSLVQSMIEGKKTNFNSIN